MRKHPAALCYAAHERLREVRVRSSSIEFSSGENRWQSERVLQSSSIRRESTNKGLNKAISGGGGGFNKAISPSHIQGNPLNSSLDKSSICILVSVAELGILN